MPSIVVAHTVLNDPTPHQRSVLEAVAASADRVVVMSESAGSRLRAGFDVDPRKVTTIPHGAVRAATRADGAVARRPADPADVGPAGTGQGHRAGHRRDGVPARVLDPPSLSRRGRTHPKVLAARGRGVPRCPHRAGAATTGSARPSSFDSGYRDVASLTAAGPVGRGGRCCRTTPPTRSPPACSIEAIAARASGRGDRVPARRRAARQRRRDRRGPRRPGGDRRRAAHRADQPGRGGEAMAAEATRLAPSLRWPVVAARVPSAGDRLLLAPRARRWYDAAAGPGFDHLLRMTDELGTVRARHCTPNPDASTATASTTWPAAWSCEPRARADRPPCSRLVELYLRFVAGAPRTPTGASATG